MPIEKWSDDVSVLHLSDDPQFTDDLDALEQNPGHARKIVLDFAAVHFINSSNIAKLLRLRKRLVSQDGRLILSNVGTQVWSTFLVTGLDKVFAFSENVTTALMQIGADT
jgi:anti-anti-sigma factor